MYSCVTGCDNRRRKGIKPPKIVIMVSDIIYSCANRTYTGESSMKKPTETIVFIAFTTLLLYLFFLYVRFLFFCSIGMMLQYTLFIQKIRKDSENVRTYFIFLLALVPILAIFSIPYNSNITFFLLGVEAPLILLWKFRALSFMKETRKEAFLKKYLRLPIHHSLYGLVGSYLFFIFLYIDLLPTWITCFLLGGSLFLVTSQIPEIIEKGLFW